MKTFTTSDEGDQHTSSNSSVTISYVVLRQDAAELRSHLRIYSEGEPTCGGDPVREYWMISFFVARGVSLTVNESNDGHTNTRSKVVKAGRSSARVIKLRARREGRVMKELGGLRSACTGEIRIVILCRLLEFPINAFSLSYSSQR